MKKTITIALFLSALSPLLNPTPLLAKTKFSTSSRISDQRESNTLENTSFTLSSQYLAREQARILYIDQLEKLRNMRDSVTEIARKLPTAKERSKARTSISIEFKKSQKEIKDRYRKTLTNIAQLYSTPTFTLS